MPLMQLSNAVLPAPFGPISAVTLPVQGVEPTSRNTCKPPKLERQTSISMNTFHTLNASGECGGTA